MFVSANTLRRLARPWRYPLLTIFTIGGGTAGAMSCIGVLRSAGSVRNAIAIVVLLMLYVFGIVAGLAFTKSGTTSSRWVRAFLLVQVPLISSPFITFNFSALASYVISVTLGHLAVHFSWLLGSDWAIALFQAGSEVTVGVNVVPLLLLPLLADHSDGLYRGTEHLRSASF